jgi:Na+-driven multidrug efflux pump
MAVGIMGIFGLIFFIFPEYLVRMFSNDKEVRETAVIVLRIMALYQISDAVFIVFKGVLNGVNDTKYVRNMILIGSWFIMVPVSFLLAVALKMGVLGAWLGLTAYVTVIALFYWKRFQDKFKGTEKCCPNINV